MDKFELADTLQAFAQDKGWLFFNGDSFYTNIDTDTRHDIGQISLWINLTASETRGNGNVVNAINYSGQIALGRKFDDDNTPASLDETFQQKYDRRLKLLMKTLSNELSSFACLYELSITGANYIYDINKFDTNLDFVIGQFTIIQNDFTITPGYYELTIQANAGGTTSPIPGVYQKNVGAIVPMFALPDAGYRFLNWVVEGVTKLTQNVYTVMNSSSLAVANFMKQWTLTSSVVGNGTIDAVDGTYDEGATQTVTATPSPGSVFSKFTRNAVDSFINPIIITFNENITLVATFISNLVNLIVTKTGNGTITPDVGIYPTEPGTNVEFTAVESDPDFYFDGFYVDTVKDETNPLTLTINEETEVECRFLEWANVLKFVTFQGSINNVLTVNSEDFNFKDNAPFSISCFYNVSTLINNQSLNVWRRGGNSLSTEVISIRIVKANETTVTAIVRMYASNHTDGIYIINNIQNIKGWNHFAITFDGINADGFKMYANNLIATNAVVTNTLTSLNPTIYPNTVGLNADGGTPQYGSIDDLLIFDRVLNQTEITELYRNDYRYGVLNLTTYSNIISYWNFNGDINDKKGINHFTATTPVYENSVVKTYLSTMGNDGTAQVNSEVNKYLTINASIDGMLAVRSRYSYSHLEDGEYDVHTYTKTINNWFIIGTTKPVYDNLLNPTKLINGTILKGYSRFYISKNTYLKNIGCDAGLQWCTDFNGGAAVNALAFDGASFPIIEVSVDHTLINVITLCKDPTALFHAAIFERIRGLSITDLETAFATHGIVFKCRDVVGSGLVAYGNVSDGFVVKKDVSGQTVGNINIDGFKYRNKTGSPVSVNIAIGSEIALQPADNVTILNADLDNTSTLISVGLATNILIKDTDDNILYP